MNRIVIIGNGNKVLKAKKRDFVDSSTMVIRLNNFRIEGYEDYVGTKTDVYSCYTKYLDYIGTSDAVRLVRCKKAWEYLLVDQADAVERTSPEDFQKKKEDYFKIHTFPRVDPTQLKIWHLFVTDKSKMKSYPFDVVISDIEFDLNYSTGFRTILYALKHYADHEIYVTGFDNFFGSGWYWDYTAKMDDQFARTQRYTDGHPYLVERTKMKELLKSGTIREI